MARYSSTFVMVVIAVSVINFIVGTERFPKCAFRPAGFSPEVAYMCGAGKLSDSGSPLAEFLNGLETFCIMVFTVEYVLRILTCTTKMRIRHFVLAPMNVIDLIAILPWYLDLVLAVLKAEVSVEALSLLRVVRLTRVVRIFKMSKNFQGLIVLGRTLNRSLTAITLLLTFVMVLIVVFATLIYQFEAGDWKADESQPGRGQFVRLDGNPSPFLSILHSFYWVLVTMTTVGYGDAYPITSVGKVIAGCAMMSGLIVLTLPITIIGANFDEEAREQQRLNERSKRAAARRPSVEIQEDGSATVLAHLVPGFDEAAELVQDHKNNVRSEMEALMGKLEKDLTEALVKVIVQSRITKREKTRDASHPAFRPSACPSVSSATAAPAAALGRAPRMS